RLPQQRTKGSCQPQLVEAHDDSAFVYVGGHEILALPPPGRTLARQCPCRRLRANVLDAQQRLFARPPHLRPDMSNETLTIWPQRLGLGPEVARVSSWSGSIRWSSRPR